MGLVRFVVQALRCALSGGIAYRLWLAFLVALAAWGGLAYVDQIRHGLIATNMRDQVSWAFYIGNFTFLVGVAAAAIILIIPAYVYDWKPIKEVAILGEILALSALVMCMLFVFVDLGRPDRFWHLLPGLGTLNWPMSLLAWDVLALNGYFVLNLVIVGYLLFCSYNRRPYNKHFVVPLILISIPAAISIHTVTAFIYNGMAARPFWNASILAPRFLASAMCSGPAILLILFQLLQRTTRFEIKDEALWKIAEIMAYAMFVNLFLLGAEVFKEVYSSTEHIVHFNYLFFGLGEHGALVKYGWTSVLCSLSAFLLFIVPATRRHPVTLNLGCLLIYIGVYIEKGMGLVIPGLTPDALGEIYEYAPTLTEVRIGVACFSVGFLVYTVLTKIAVAISLGDLTRDTVPGLAPAGQAPKPVTADA
ncbi:MAG: polysulfide reductase [Lentisphaerae bacterium RIFOXYB12_FULL_65_16]|nr:MAG: polysulfide reductase [Lentisphaerae bacterium RIFOXYA12_64_32]OGV93082.1 MAG: polysulfide reductase [Lentisphaerae bacterium RIFOXYB12_FULL_65_16]